MGLSPRRPLPDSDPHLSLVNILAGQQIVSEFMPYYTSTAPIADEALDLLADSGRRERMKADLKEVIARVGDTSAAETTAHMALRVAGVRQA